ncbi:MAG: ABC transporter permease [Myxococcota bacterium]|nr:ABC transporter permease [Myxococcota bacterium]
MSAAILGWLGVSLLAWRFAVRLLDRMRRPKFENFVAVRHLRGHKHGYLTAIGILSVLGISMSSCSLCTVLSVMGGFTGDLRDKIFQTNAHVLVDGFGSDLENYGPLLTQIRQVPGVVNATPVLQGDMMMNSRTNTRAIVLKGIDTKTFSKTSSVLSGLEKGKIEYLDDSQALFDMVRARRAKLYGAVFGDTDTNAGAKGKAEPDKEGAKDRVLPAIIVGKEIADALYLYDGAEVNIIAPLGDIGPTGPIPKSRPFRVGGVFFSGMYQFDNMYVYMGLEAAQKFLRKDGLASEIQVALADPDKADEVAGAMRALLGSKLRVRTWGQLNAELFSALKLEKIVMFLVLSLAILVASFCIVATLTMLVLEKSAEVAVMMTLGATADKVRRIFLFEGLLIGGVGTAAGVCVALMLCTAMAVIGFPIDPEVWYIDQLPVRMDPREFLSVGVAAFTITQLATLLPARQAAKLRPVEGLKL